MFLLVHPLPFVDDKFETPTFLLRKEEKYPPILYITNDVNYQQQVGLAIDRLLTLLYTILSPMEEVEIKVQEEIQRELLFLRENYPLKYLGYAKYCSTVTSIIFSNNPVEFVDAQVSILYAQLLSGEKLTLIAESYVLNLNKSLNEKIVSANVEIDFINKYGGSAMSNLETLTNYREQDYINVIKDKIDEVNIFAEYYYVNQ